MAAENEAKGMVMVSVKTPMTRRAVATMMPSELTVEECVRTLCRTPPKDGPGRHLVELLEQETAGSGCTYFSVSPSGEVAPVEGRTTLAEVAAPMEIRTPRGIERMPAASLEVQAYAKVGG